MGKTSGSKSIKSGRGGDCFTVADGVGVVIRDRLPRSSLLQRLAARVWDDVTGGTGVLLANGRPVDPPAAAVKGKKGGRS